MVALLLVASLAAASFEAWKSEHSKVYSSLEHENQAHLNYLANLKRYEIRNQEEGPNGARYGADEFSDLTPQQFLKGCYHPVSEKVEHVVTEEEKQRIRAVIEATPSLDYRSKGAVTPPKNQGAYGDCWAFGVSGVLEGVNVVQGKNKLVSLCEQELVDCCAECNGAGPGNSWDWLINNTHGFLGTEESYPYVGGPFKNRTCAAHASSTKVSTAKVSKWQLMHQDKSGNQDNLVAEVAKAGPCNIGVDAENCMLGYKGGIITNCTGKGVDHANVIVGYGAGDPLTGQGNVNYFIAKNSWGAGWGESGFYRFARNTGQLAVDACWYAYF